MSKRRVENGTDGRPVRIVDHVFIGDRNAAKARGLLTQHNIKFILNCTPDRDTDPVAGCPCFFEKDASLTYQRVPIFDNRGENLLAHIEPSVAFIDTRLLSFPSPPPAEGGAGLRRLRASRQPP